MKTIVGPTEYATELSSLALESAPDLQTSKPDVFAFLNKRIKYVLKLPSANFVLEEAVNEVRDMMNDDNLLGMLALNLEPSSATSTISEYDVSS